MFSGKICVTLAVSDCGDALRFDPRLDERISSSPLAASWLHDGVTRALGGDTDLGPSSFSIASISTPQRISRSVPSKRGTLRLTGHPGFAAPFFRRTGRAPRWVRGKWNVSTAAIIPQWTAARATERFTTFPWGTLSARSRPRARFRRRRRALIKYGVLFFVFFFTTFFLFEITARQKIHPLQYLMVGAALCLFYLALLSASEFIGFSLAYLIAAVAATGLVTWYCSHFLGGGMRTLMIGGGLLGVYTFLYTTAPAE